MRVVCIDDSGLDSMGHGDYLRQGEIYTATQNKFIKDCYDLAEIPFDKAGLPIAYYKRRFVPLSEIDETEFKRNYQIEVIN